MEEKPSRPFLLRRLPLPRRDRRRFRRRPLEEVYEQHAFGEES